MFYLFYILFRMYFIFHKINR